MCFSLVKFTNSRHNLGIFPLNPLIGIKLPKIYCYMSIATKYIDIDITTNSKKITGLIS